MFAPSNFYTTYSQPMLQTGDTLARNMRSGMQQAAFNSDRRSFIPRMSGVRAGSRGAMYRSGLAADAAAAEGYASARQNLLDNLKTNADTRLGFATNLADEQAGIRSLLLDRDRMSQTADLSERDTRIRAELEERQRRAQNRAQQMQRQSQVGGILFGLF